MILFINRKLNFLFENNWGHTLDFQTWQGILIVLFEKSLMELFLHCSEEIINVLYLSVVLIILHIFYRIGNKTDV